MLSLLLGLCIAANAKIILFTRHGQRAPTKFDEQTQDKWAPHQAGDLTQIGVEFLISKGQTLSKQFQIHDEQGNCIYERMQILSSPKQRTIMSTLSYLKGFCPSNHPDIIRQFLNDYATYSTNKTDLDALLQSDYSDIFALSNYTRTFDIEVDLLFHGHDSGKCPVIEPIEEQIIASEEYKNVETSVKSRPEFESLLEKVKQHKRHDVAKNQDYYTAKNFPFKKLKSFFGDYKCEWAQNLEVPTFTELEYKLLNDVAQYIFYDVKNGHNLQQRAAVSETFKWVISILKEAPHELFWYSGHDSNIVAILSAITDKDQRGDLGYLALPPFGSDLQWIVENGQVEMKLNGRLLRTKLCVEEITCSVEDVIGYLERYIEKDTAAFCNNL